MSEVRDVGPLTFLSKYASNNIVLHILDNACPLILGRSSMRENFPCSATKVLDLYATSNPIPGSSIYPLTYLPMVANRSNYLYILPVFLCTGISKWLLVIEILVNSNVHALKI